MEPTIGTIILFAANFPPRNWAYCEGQLLPINQNQSLYSILGTTYGGDGRTTFALPDLRGRVPIQRGDGAGLSPHNLGTKGGAETNTLTVQNLPAHSHVAGLKVSSSDATLTQAATGTSIATPGAVSGRDFVETNGYNTAAPNTALNAGSVVTGNTGANQPLNNMEPSLAINYIICLRGLFPSRN